MSLKVYIWYKIIDLRAFIHPNSHLLVTIEQPLNMHLKSFIFLWFCCKCKVKYQFEFHWEYYFYKKLLANRNKIKSNGKISFESFYLFICYLFIFYLFIFYFLFSIFYCHHCGRQSYWSMKFSFLLNLNFLFENLKYWDYAIIDKICDKSSNLLNF